MHRRHLISLALGLPLGGLTLAAVADTLVQPDDAAQALPQFKVSAARLQQAVAQRFPLRYPVSGLLNLDLQAPQLSLLPAQNRLGAEMAIDAAGPALQGSHHGTLALDFALRYEASDLTVRAHQLRFKQLTMPSLQPRVAMLLNTYGPTLSERALMEVVLHRLQPSDLALPNSMGLQPGSISVTDTGLVIGFVPKPLSPP
ncbi:DUF1439 domain-containing protein [Rhodoferax fermentans]|uniref:DUF1439 domain-containing protein n=1 Tax=Rhodoferax fermentans TaxID=28066 RepID=A0A1T1AS74_RHOFE|nr:DUF1439 domain-containing protein [Rhodoferax fermentans]MBK1684077.1 DUF1439 domain-containing protein [Rhodoferax fermentans]OOV06959.1 DUF1439 domain-containing protein [Rhodoferax fermentans]